MATFLHLVHRDGADEGALEIHLDAMVKEVAVHRDLASSRREAPGNVVLCSKVKKPLLVFLVWIGDCDLYPPSRTLVSLNCTAAPPHRQPSLAVEVATQFLGARDRRLVIRHGPAVTNSDVEQEAPDGVMRWSALE